MTVLFPNMKFGNFTVVSSGHRSFTGRALVLCRCRCGNEKKIRVDHLINGDTKSCGCLRSINVGKVTHGGSKSDVYKIWRAMIRRCDPKRCDNKHYRNYVMRGVTVCERWKHDFNAFKEDVGARPSPQHTLDRIDGNKGYEPGNVRWATAMEQCRNRSSNRVITIDGVSRCVAEWAEVFGVDGRRVVAYIERLTMKPLAEKFSDEEWFEEQDAVPF